MVRGGGEEKVNENRLTKINNIDMRQIGIVYFLRTEIIFEQK